jgi:ADP-heptose:LPS heptosyltransferase
LHFDFKAASVLERWALNDALIREEYDLALCPYTTPTPFFIPFLLSVPVRVGHRVERTAEFQGAWWKYPTWMYQYQAPIEGFDHTHETERYMRLLQCLGYEPKTHILNSEAVYATFEPTPQAAEAAQNLASAWGIVPNNGSKPVVALHATAGVMFGWKHWGNDHFIELSRRLIHETSATVVLMGGVADNSVLQTLQAAIGAGSVVFCPDESSAFLGIEQTRAVLSLCDVVVGNESGIGHLSVASAIPTVRIIPMTDYWGVRALGGHHADIWKNLPCSPCVSLGTVKHGYNLNTCGHRNCLHSISVEEVFQATVRLLEQRTPTAPQ